MMLEDICRRRENKSVEQKYLHKIHRHFRAGPDEKKLFSRIAGASSRQRGQILQDVTELVKRRGLVYGLLALFRQQVNCGFVLGDPLGRRGKEIKLFKDKTTGVTFRFLWNPDRELRKNHSLLIERGVIAENIGGKKLINRDKKGKPCYLCVENIAEQNPAEILLPLRLAGEAYYAGANFAYIENNHFTVMSTKHRKQLYEKHILVSLVDFIEQTDGFFRAIFNGLAGATILGHEHLQVTTEPFPIEDIQIRKGDVKFRKGSLRVARPFYYTPLWVVEGGNKNSVIEEADHVIVRWHKLNPKYHTENVIAVKSGRLFRLFIFLRDTRRLAGEGKFGDMASFECAGSIVLSYQPSPEQTDRPNERNTFKNADLASVRTLLRSIAPIVPDVDFVA
jgi:hypothetical protein